MSKESTRATRYHLIYTHHLSQKELSQHLTTAVFGQHIGSEILRTEMERRSLKEKEDIEGTEERRKSSGEGIRKCREDAIPVSFAKPYKMFSSHKINLVSANYLESVP